MAAATLHPGAVPAGAPRVVAGGLLGRWLAAVKARHERRIMERHLLTLDDATLASYGLDRNLITTRADDE